jgi:hypothetical protein
MEFLVFLHREDFLNEHILVTRYIIKDKTTPSSVTVEVFITLILNAL